MAHVWTALLAAHHALHRNKKSFVCHGNYPHTGPLLWWYLHAVLVNSVHLKPLKAKNGDRQSIQRLSLAPAASHCCLLLEQLKSNSVHIGKQLEA